MKNLCPRFAMIMVLSFCGIASGEDPGDFGQPFTLTILHLNDTHSNFLPGMISVSLPPDSLMFRIPAGSIARISSLVDSIRLERETVLFLHAGDMVQGTLFYTLFGGEADVAVYNAIGLDAMSPGNHEFDRGSEGLSILLEDAEFDIICANLDVSRDSLLAGRIAPWTVFGTGDERVGVIGLIVDELANVSSPSEGTTVLPPRETAQSAIDQLEDRGVNKIILLTHIGYEDDLDLASGLSGADIIVGGHSHTILGGFPGTSLHSSGSYPTVTMGADGEDVLVVQAGTGASILGDLNVDFDTEGHVIACDGSPVIATGGDYQDADRSPLSGEALDRLVDYIESTTFLIAAPEDPAVRELVGIYELELAAFAYEVVGTAPVDLQHRRVPGEELPDGSMIAPVICDAMLWKAEQVGLQVDIALLNAGGARIPVPAGDITVGTIYTLMPFGNSLAVLEMTGEDIKDVMEDAMSNIFDDGNSDGSFPYTAGLRYTANASSPEGERITAMEVLGSNGWTIVDPAGRYRVITSYFLAGGGDGYTTFSGIEAMDTGFIDAEVFMDYLMEKGSITPVESRVSFTAGE